MANSLRAKISKLRHDGNLTEAEYKEIIRKLDGHDREFRNKIIDEFAEGMKELVYKWIDKGVIAIGCIDEIAEQMKGGK